jgi:hypothetical protein
MVPLPHVQLDNHHEPPMKEEAMTNLPNPALAISAGGRDPRFAEAAVGVDGRVDQLDELTESVSGLGTNKRVDHAAIMSQSACHEPLAILMDRAQLCAGPETFLLRIHAR